MFKDWYLCNEYFAIIHHPEIMKKFFILLILFAVTISCSHKQKTQEDFNKIIVSIYPQKYFVERIAGSNVDEIMVMIPPGSSPAIYDPTPKQMASLSDADIYFSIGHIGFEKAWLERFEKSNPDVKFVDMSTGINLLETCGHHHDEIDHGIDPHIWLSPRNAMFMAQNIYTALADYDPDNQLEYIRNYNQLVRELKSLDSTINISLQGFSNRSFLIYHPALTYFAKDYKLEQISIESEGKAPSVQHMKEIMDLASDRGIQHIFVQREFDQEHAQKVADEIGAELIVIEPLQEDWVNGINEITQGISGALKKQNAR